MVVAVVGVVVDVLVDVVAAIACHKFGRGRGPGKRGRGRGRGNGKGSCHGVRDVILTHLLNGGSVCPLLEAR